MNFALFSITALLLVSLSASAFARPRSEEVANHVVSSHVVPSVVNEPVVAAAPVVAVDAAAAAVVEPAVVVARAPQPVVSQYAPVEAIADAAANQAQANGASASSAVKPAEGAARGEQYGQPESAAIPPNYKPFGSWGLYIGGNPADGYYTNYYKSLSSSLDKQQAGGADKPLRSLNPILRQAGGSPYQGADFYPFSYSAADFSANSQLVPQVHNSNPEPFGPSSYIPEFYASKRVGHAKGYQGADAQHQQQTQQHEPHHQSKSSSSAKGSHSAQPNFYAAPVSGAVQSAVSQASPQSQVVPYPVPVGSQIVGSQVGVDGAFYPYGVHAFTKYALKPTVVDSVQALNYQPSAYQPNVYSASQFSVVQPSYKYGSVQTSTPLFASPAQNYPSHYADFARYVAYPASQLHYANGVVVPTIQSNGFENLHSVAHVVPSYSADEVSAKSIKG